MKMDKASAPGEQMRELELTAIEQVRIAEAGRWEQLISVAVYDLVFVIESSVFFAGRIWDRMSERFKSVNYDSVRCLEQLKAIISTQHYASGSTGSDLCSIFYKAGLSQGSRPFLFTAKSMEVL